MKKHSVIYQRLSKLRKQGPVTPKQWRAVRVRCIANLEAAMGAEKLGKKDWNGWTLPRWIVKVVQGWLTFYHIVSMRFGKQWTTQQSLGYGGRQLQDKLEKEAKEWEEKWKRWEAGGKLEPDENTVYVDRHEEKDGQ